MIFISFALFLYPFAFKALLHCIAEQQGIKDPCDKMELFVSLLLSVLLDSGGSSTSTKTENYGLLVKKTEKGIGGFRNLQVGNLKDFLRKRFNFSFDEDSEETVFLTEKGHETFSNWIHRVNNSPDLRAAGISSTASRNSVTNTLAIGYHAQKVNDNNKVNSMSSKKQTPSKSSRKHIKSTERVRGGEEDVTEIESHYDVSQPKLTEDNTSKWITEVEKAREEVEEATGVNAETMKFLSKHLSEFDSRFGFFLIASSLPECDAEGYKGIVNIPWLRVFDFDCESRRRGLLLSVEQLIKSKRNLTISTLCEPTRKLSNRATDWLFMKGFADKPETVEDQTAMEWIAFHNKELQKLCMTIVDFCFCKKQAIFLVLWYDKHISSVDFLVGFLLLLTQNFNQKLDKLPMEIILCIPSQDAAESSKIRKLIGRLHLKEKTITISISAITRYLQSFEISNTLPQDKIKLPKRSEDEKVEYAFLDNSVLSWVADYVELLPLEEETAKTSGFSAGEAFVRGGTITWEEIRFGRIAVKREIQDEFLRKVKREYIDECKSTVIDIYHTPGGGGTTFGRQALWNLHKFAPCGVVIPSSSLTTSDLAERLELLHSLTQLPVVLLIDGGSQYEVDLLYANRTFAVIILHVQRYSVQDNSSRYEAGGPCYLSGRVTKREAKDLATLFSQFAPKSRNALFKLYRESKQGSHKQVFEFGLTAFNHEFKGVKSYVSGYLEPHNHEQELPNWKKIVLYLSILKFFGQTEMPRQVFSHLVESDYRFVTLDDVHQGQYFITESKDLDWRINYHAVAKEVIENLLGSGMQSPDVMSVSDAVKAKLHKHVIEFIHLLGDLHGELESETITKPIYNSILKRDSHDVDANDSIPKTKLSRLLENVEERYQLSVLQELVKAFPSAAEFHAHLGRYLSLVRKFDEADKSLQKALEIRTAEKAGSSPNKTDNVRGRIHHMFGNSLTKRILHAMKAEQLGKFSKSRYPKDSSFGIDKILPFARKAIENFAQGRKFIVTNRNYGYVGEAKVRLLVVEFAVKTISNCVERAFKNTLGKDKVKLAEFVRESHSVCDQLLVECHNIVPTKELSRVSDYTNCVSYFYQFFGLANTRLQSVWRDDDASIPMRRSSIATIKAKYFVSRANRKNVRLPSVYDVGEAEDINKIIGLHERTIKNVLEGNIRDVSISNDMQEWLDAVRHPLVEDRYHLEDVRCKVEQWNQKNEFGYSLFYLYVITFLSAISCPGKEMIRKQVLKLSDLHEQVRSRYKYIGLKRGSKEILANHKADTIRKLIPAHSAGWDKDAKKFKNSSGLKVCTGTVIQSDKPLIGFISLDADYVVPGKPFKVYFVPKPCGLYGSRFSHQKTRVEFFTGFSIGHGAEALQVKELIKRHCRRCGGSREIITLNQEPGFGSCTSCEYTDSFKFES